MITIISTLIVYFRANKFLKAWKEKNIKKMKLYCSKVYQEKKNFIDLCFLTEEINMIGYEIVNIKRISNVIYHAKVRIMLIDDAQIVEKDIKLRMIGMSKPYETSRFLGFGVEVGFLMKGVLN